MRGCETTLSLEAHAAMSDSNGDSVYDTVILPPLVPDLEFIQALNMKGNSIHFQKKYISYLQYCLILVTSQNQIKDS